MFLKDVVSYIYYELNCDNQQLIKKGSEFRRGSVGVRYGKPATNYAKDAWDKVTYETIKNSINKAYLRISLDNDVFLKLFKNINSYRTRY